MGRNGTVDHNVVMATNGIMVKGKYSLHLRLWCMLNCPYYFDINSKQSQALDTLLSYISSKVVCTIDYQELHLQHHYDFLKNEKRS